MKTFKTIIILATITVSGSKDEQLQNDTESSNLTTSFDFRDDNRTENHESSIFQQKSKVKFYYDSFYSSTFPRELIVHEFQWQITGVIMPHSLTRDFVQGETDIEVVLTTHNLPAPCRGIVVSRWRVRVDAGNGTSGCSWSPWIDYNP